MSDKIEELNKIICGGTFRPTHSDQELSEELMAKMKGDTDNVNHPSHYTTGKIEVYDFIEDQKLGYNEGNIVKYICRHPHKGQSLQDLQKANWYLKKLIVRIRMGE
jgi:hypothetical protein